MTQLTDAQVAAIQRQKDQRSAKELAQEHGLPRKQVEALLAQVRFPPWRDREGWGWLLAGAVLVLALGSWAFANNHQGGLVFDDAHSIRDNQAIRVFYEHVEHDEGGFVDAGKKAAAALYDFNLYRLVTFASFSLTYYDHPLADAETEEEYQQALAGWHAANNRIHLLNGLLVLWLAYLTFTAPVFQRSLKGPHYPAAAAILVAVVFVTHPLQTQAVSYLSQRAESLCATFYLLSLCCYISARQLSLRDDFEGSQPWLTPAVLGGAGLLATLVLALAKTTLLGAGGVLVGVALLGLAAVAALVWLQKSGRDTPLHAGLMASSALAFGLAVGTKEVGATIPLVAVLWDLFFVPPPADAAPARGPWIARALRRASGWRARYLSLWLGLLLAAAVLAVVFMGDAIQRQLLVAAEAGGRQDRDISGSQYLLTQANVLWTYVRLTFLPYGQNLDYDYPVALQSGGATALAVLSGLAILGTAGVALWRGGRARAAAFGFLFLLCVLAPSSSLIVLPDVIYEHRFYLPLLGLLLPLGAAAERLARSGLPEAARPWALTGAALVLGLALAAAARERNEVWRSDMTLWTDVAAKSPDKPRAWLNLGLAYQDREAYEVVSGGKAVRGVPFELPGGTLLVASTVNMGQIAPMPPGSQIVELEGGPEKALECYAKALAIDDDYTKALNNKALVHIALGAATKGAAALLSQEGRRLEGLRQELLQAGEQEQAAQVSASLEVLGASYDEYLERSREHYRQAAEALERVVELRPNDFAPLNNLGNLLATELQEYERASSYIRQSLNINDAPQEGWAALGDITMLRGEQLRARGEDPTRLWQEARGYYEQYLLSGSTRFRSSVRERYEVVEGYLSGKLQPPPLGEGAVDPDDVSQRLGPLPGPGGP